jgi:hypothetical protein
MRKGFYEERILRRMPIFKAQDEGLMEGVTLKPNLREG